MSHRFTIAALVAATLGLAAVAEADNGWNGRRLISRQRKNDLFYNYYVGPQPNSAVAGMYPSPQPVPPAMGHTYVTYQPFMPHEYLYQHHRSYWTHNPGNGWTRTKVRYGASANVLQAITFGMYDDTKAGWLYNARFFDHLDRLQAFDY